MRSVLVVGGGQDRRETMQKVRHTSPNILVATPGRLIDLVENFGLDISKVK
jgi:superfamily II DNA/RNA helicase